MLQTIPLDQLARSPHNVRKTGGATVDELAASIRHHGLLQNLAVTKPAGAGPYLVTSGGRRLQALQRLSKEGAIPKDYPVPCRVLEGNVAGEASLAENVIRQSMHPADEFDAFKALVDQGSTSDEIAARFGCTPRHVEQRLRLAAVDPEILAEYRAGKATLEQMQVLTLTDDHKAQRAAWKQSGRSAWGRDPENLRNALVDDEVSGDSKLARYVGEKAYEAAGGRVRRDLFGEDVFFPDSKLLTKLAEEKMQKHLDKVLKEGWKWGEVRHTFGWGDEQKFGTARGDASGNKMTWSDEVMATAGVIVSLNAGGGIEVKRGLVRPEDRKEAAKAVGGEEKIAGGKTAKPAKKPGELTFAGLQRLQGEATAIVRSALAQNPQRALALLVAQLAEDWQRRAHSAYGIAPARWVHIGREHSGRIHGDVEELIYNSPYREAHRLVGEKYDALLKVPGTDRLTWALHQSTDTLLELLAYLVARETEDVDVYNNGLAKPAAFAEAAGVDLGDTWKPTLEWLATLPKATIVELVTEANGRKGKALAAPLQKMKRGDELAKAALPLFPPRWLPPALRAPKARAKLDAKQKAAGEGRDDE